MWIDPPLTTVRPPLRQKGRVAARTLLDLIDGKVPDSYHLQLVTGIAVREPSAGPKG